jgi:CRP-like cAMP-binding protein
MPVMIKHQAPSCLQDIFRNECVPCTSRHLRKGELLWNDKEPHQYCYLVRTGLIKLYVVTADGRENALFFYTNGTLLGFQNLSDVKQTITAAVAMLPTTLYAADFTKFYGFILNDYKYSRALTEYLFYHMAAEAQEIVDISLSGIDERLAALLVTLADEYLECRQGEVRIPLNNDELAGMIGACRNSVYNALSAFQRQKLVRKHRGNVEIVDLDRLRELQNTRRT